MREEAGVILRCLTQRSDCEHKMRAAVSDS